MMPAPHPEKFRRRAVELARERSRPIAQLAKELGVSDSGLRKWISQADIDEGDVTEHPTGEGKVYVAVVIDAWSRRVIGWSIADHLRTELVCDALDVACWRRRPQPGG